MWVYNYEWGVINELLREVGLPGLAHSWLGDPKTALWAVMFTHVWKWTGFNMVVCLAALYALPTEILEAAALDNCGWLRRLLFVMIPMMWRTLLNLLILSFIGKMRVFDLVWIMTGGGPLWSTETVSTYVYKRAFEWNSFDLGYPSTIATLWFVVVLAFALAPVVGLPPARPPRVLAAWPMTVAGRRPRSAPTLNVPEYASGRRLAASLICSVLGRAPRTACMRLDSFATHVAARGL